MQKDILKIIAKSLKKYTPKSINLGLALAEKQHPTFFEWFHSKVTQVLFFCETDIELTDEILYAPTAYNGTLHPQKMQGEFKFEGVNFRQSIFNYIAFKGYMSFCELRKCDCNSSMPFCRTENRQAECSRFNDLPF